MLKHSGNTPTRPVGLWNRLSAGFVFLTCLGAVLSYSLVDQAAQEFTAQFGFRGDFRAFLDFVGFLGHGIFCAFVVVAILCLDWAKRKQAMLIVAAALLASAISSAIKYSIHRERPAVVAGRETVVSDSTLSRSPFQSFPSGHTTSAFALATSLACIYPHGKIFFFSLAILVGMQRVLIQAHYPSDVFAGALIGFLAAIVIRALFEKVSKP